MGFQPSSPPGDAGDLTPKWSATSRVVSQPRSYLPAMGVSSSDASHTPIPEPHDRCRARSLRASGSLMCC